jgi:hypothetical protein
MRTLHGPIPPALTALLLVMLAVPRVNAQTDTAGKAVAPNHANNEVGPTTIPDGLGGAFVGFIGNTSCPLCAIAYAHFVAHVDANGDPVAGWSTGAIGNLDVSSAPAVIASSEPGLVWVAPSNVFAGAPDHFLARPIRDLGITVPDSSVTTALNYAGVSLVAQGAGGVLVTGVGSALRVARIESSGAFTELPDVPLPHPFWSAPAPEAFGPRPVSDGAGGAWIACELGTNNGQGPSDIAAVRLSADGSAALTPAYRMVCTAIRNQHEAVLAVDGSGGVFIAWADQRDLTKSSDVYAAHLLADGSLAPGWQAQGTPIASFPGDQFQPQIVGDGSGGVWLAWTDSRSGENDIYYTHLGSDGAPRSGFPVGGNPLCAAAGGQIDSRIVADGEGGFYAVWLDDRNGNLDLYAQHIHSTGVVMPGWVADGLPICTDPTPQLSPALVLSSPHHALATWIDTRTVYQKVFAATLPPDGPVAGVAPGTPRVGLSVRAAQDPARGTVGLFVSSSEAGDVRVTLHDVTGRVVGERVLQGPVNAASVQFAASRLGPGLYFARAARSGATTNTRVSLVR